MKLVYRTWFEDGSRLERWVGSGRVEYRIYERGQWDILPRRRREVFVAQGRKGRGGE